MTTPSAHTPYGGAGFGGQPSVPPAGIVVQGLTKAFGTHTAVAELSFTVPPGSVTGFLGPNGSGKTTTLGMVLGLIRPTSGAAFVDGVPFADLEHPAQTVGAVLDARSAHPKHTALTHLRVYCAAIGVPDTRATQMLDLVGLAPAAKRRIGEFSLGMRQRLALATALLGQPRYLVLDEPANGLDPEGMAWLRDFLVSYARNGGTVLISSHILREVEQMADHLVIISNGALVAASSMEELRATYRPRVLVAASDPARLATALAAAGHTDAQVQPDGRLAVVGLSVDRITTLAAESQVTLFGTTVESVDLEQVYLSMTAGRYTATHPGPGGPWNGPGWGQPPHPAQQYPGYQQYPGPAQITHPPQYANPQHPGPHQQYAPQPYPPQPYPPQPYPAQPNPPQQYYGPPQQQPTGSEGPSA
ncbi:ABC transporter ATP-binding protein [Rhodococcus sp. 105337]|nr:ABC transporter ATP-binding protein [Rhodococcus sp. 105337]